MSNAHIPSWGRPNNLRSQDRYIQEVLHQYPVAPRIFDDQWYPIKNWIYLWNATVFFVLIALLIYSLPYLRTLIDAGTFWGSPLGLGFVFFVIPGMLWWFFTLVEPWYHWRMGLRYGRMATAVVQRVTARPARTSVRGIWMIYGSHSTFTAVFGAFSHEHDTWVQHLREGDRIQVLLHPTKDKVLLAYGP